MDFDWEEDEPSVLEYARLHAICIDHTTEPLLSGDLQAALEAVIDPDFQVPSDASIPNTIIDMTRERLAINKDAALLLRSILDMQKASPSNSFATEKRTWIISLKQEPPLLQTDNELDLLSFGSAALPDLRDLKIPFEITDEERDEGLEWPSKYHAYPAQYDEQAKAEKITISREVLVYLQDAVRDTYLPEDSEMIKAESLRYKPNTPTKLTPPLLPLSPPLTPYIPSSATSRLPLDTDSSDSLVAELRDVERQIISNETLEHECFDSNDLMLLDLNLPPQLSLSEEGQELSELKSKAESLKVEGPLTPPIFSTSPMKKFKCVSFAETLHEFIPSENWAATLTDEDGNSSIDFEECFEDLKPLAMEAEKRVENERLSGPDTTSRVEVPEVDCSLPIAPWNEYSQSTNEMIRPSMTELDLQRRFLLRLQHDDLRSVITWHGLAILERELRWNIFTINVGVIDVNEQLHGETDLNKTLTELSTSGVATSFSQTWKREGLRILDEEEDEEFIEPQDVCDDGEIENLVRKRKSEMDETTEMHPNRKRPSQTFPRVKYPVPSHANSSTHDHNKDKFKVQNTGRNSHETSTTPSNGLMFGGFSATSALHKFMETRGKIASTGNSNCEKQITLKNGSVSTVDSDFRHSKLPVPELPVKSKTTSIQSKEITCVEQQPSILPDLPSIPKNLPPCSFIVSSLLLHRRGLMKQIESFYPETDMVYRDYNLSQSHSKEADFILSPSTGLIFTTLQQTKQRALPGQPKRAPVKERMKALCLRYERLIVMIGEGVSTEMEDLGSSRPEDHRDKEVLMEYENFASGLEGDVLVKYVPGGERALARFILLEMVKYGLPHGSADIGDIKPPILETNWEIFLRRVGLNTFAAQVIIAMLKQPVSIRLPASSNLPLLLQNQSTVSISGLPAFLMMNEEDRVRHFQAVMGGSRVLKRVSSILDQEWISAAHGFQL